MSVNKSHDTKICLIESHTPPSTIRVFNLDTATLILEHQSEYLRSISSVLLFIMEEDRSSLVSLPAELVLQILSYLDPPTLAQVSATCQALRRHALVDHLWHSHINTNPSVRISSPYPLDNFRDLYVAQHPYWFLINHRLWISDALEVGKLLLTRYDEEHGCIEAYTVAAERGVYNPERWSYDPNVVIHHFEPHVRLDLNKPVIRIAVGSPKTDDATAPPKRSTNGILSLRSTGQEKAKRSILSQEVILDCSSSVGPHGVKSSLMLAHDYPATSDPMLLPLWPIPMLPAPSRTLNTSSDGFSGNSHRPVRLSEVSQNTFRIKNWFEFPNRQARANIASNVAVGLDRLSSAAGLGFTGADTERRGLQIHTYGTLSPEAYTPTPRKPFQGIYCGDYSAHGCEFLLVLQPEEGTEDPLPRGLAWLREWLESGERTSHRNSRAGQRNPTNAMDLLLGRLINGGAVQHEMAGDVDELIAQMDQADQQEEEGHVPQEEQQEPQSHQSTAESSFASSSAQPAPVEDSDTNPDIYSGRLVAIKLTGDQNVPRGQITFIAPDLGDKGFIRTANEETFRGARVVKCAGHVAGRGFRNGNRE